MASDRATLILGVLEELGVDVWRSTRYANNTGTCMWCSTGALVMVPDSDKLEWFAQAEGAEELQARMAPLVEARLTEAATQPYGVLATDLQVDGASSPALRALVGLGEQLRREGYDEALGEARTMFVGIMRSKFGPLPPIIEHRIQSADFGQLQRWSERIFTVSRAMLVVA